MKIVCSQFLLLTAIVVVYATNINPEQCIPRPLSGCLEDCCERYTKKTCGPSFRKKRKLCKDKCREAYRIVFKGCKRIEPPPEPEPGTIIDYLSGFPCNKAEVPFSLNQNPRADDRGDYPSLMPYDGDPSKCFVRMTPYFGDYYNPRGPSMFLSHKFDETNEKYSFAMMAGYRMFGDDNEYADGIVFLLHQHEDGVEACCGDRGIGLGYQNKYMPAIAIELDTYGNHDEDKGPNNIHVVSVDGSNTRTTLAERGPLPLRTGGDGTSHGRLWVDYPDDEVLRVYLDSSGNEIKPPEPQVAVSISLKNFFVGNEIFVGFTAGTWGLDDNQDILDWTMKEA